MIKYIVKGYDKYTQCHGCTRIDLDTDEVTENFKVDLLIDCDFETDIYKANPELLIGKVLVADSDFAVINVANEVSFAEEQEG